MTRADQRASLGWFLQPDSWIWASAFGTGPRPASFEKESCIFI